MLGLAALVTAALAARCGARTGLPLPEVCGKPGDHRVCSDNCGQGQQVCEDGFWQPCEVPAASRACANACGPGEQQCVNDQWLPCSVPVATRSCSSICGAGTETCTEDAWGPCNAPAPGPPTLQATVRNIYLGQPDFREACCSGSPDPGIVETTLGSDGEPVYAGNPITGTLTTTGASNFMKWYHDAPGENLSTTISLVFVPAPGQPGINQYDNESFFPIDGQLFGNQGAPDNENFTVQTHADVLYTGGESYGFTSDDDLWVFINQTLAVDLGGIHAALSANIALDSLASQLGITPGQTYPMDVFYANREPPGAVLVMSIPQSDLWSCP